MFTAVERCTLDIRSIFVWAALVMSSITVNPLECGGPDDAGNMQWQTTADAKAKSKTEGKLQALVRLWS